MWRTVQVALMAPTRAPMAPLEPAALSVRNMQSSGRPPKSSAMMAARR
jgi:hypothetical protein